MTELIGELSINNGGRNPGLQLTGLRKVVLVSEAGQVGRKQAEKGGPGSLDLGQAGLV